MRPRRVSLVLGAGGARGYADVGAMEELTKRGHEIVAAAGSSIRALGGGFYAAGKLDEFAEWALGLSRRDVLRLVDVSVAGPGLARAERVMRTIRELVRGRPAPDSPAPPRGAWWQARRPARGRYLDQVLARPRVTHVHASCKRSIRPRLQEWCVRLVRHRGRQDADGTG